VPVPEPTIVDTDSLKRRPLPAHPPALYTVAEIAEPIVANDGASPRVRKLGFSVTPAAESGLPVGEPTMLGTPVVGVWLAIDEATLDNGCMRLLDGGHRANPRPHLAIRDWQLCDTDRLGVGSVAVPLAALTGLAS